MVDLGEAILVKVRGSSRDGDDAEAAHSAPIDALVKIIIDVGRSRKGVSFFNDEKHVAFLVDCLADSAKFLFSQ